MDYGYNEQDNNEYEIAKEQADQIQSVRIVRKVGWTLFLMAVVSLVSQNLILFIANRFFPEITTNGWFLLSVTAVTVIGIDLPLVYAMLKNVPETERAPKARLKPIQFFGLFIVCTALMYLANYISVFINYFFVKADEDIINPLYDILAGSSMWIIIAYVAIIGPIVEEVIFRKILLDKMRRFGDLPAILVTGFAFGLFHMNLSQFFYATVLGFIFAYVTIRTNTILYSVLLHIIINTIGSVLAQAALMSMNTILILLISLWIIAAIAAGLGLLIANRKRILLVKSSLALQKKSYYLFNPGMLLFTILCITMMVLTVLA